MTTLPLLLLSLASFVYSKVQYKDLVAPKARNNSPAVIPLHLLDECPSDEDNFIPYDESTCHRMRASEDRVPTTTVRFVCSFTQWCFNRTMQITCMNYERTCDTITNTCNETYGKCEVRNETRIETMASGFPAKLYAECIPMVNAVRDQCTGTSVGAEVSWTYSPGTNELLSCTMETMEFQLNCYNYTRYCPLEVVTVENSEMDVSRWVSKEDTNCSFFITQERRWDQHMIWNDTVKEITETGEEILQGAMIINRTLYENWTQDDAWEKCIEVTQVPYEPQCNQFVINLLEPMKAVIYEPNAHSLTEGVRLFLEKYDGGFDILCKYDCFYKLIKFSRTCWPGLPLQRFVPGSDYRTLEMLFRNMTRIACYITDAPLIKYDVSEDYMNSRNSCAIFFDPQHNITRSYYNNITTLCVEGEDMCNEGCKGALDSVVSRFGCCLGSIIYQYEASIKWLQLFNFADNLIINNMRQCGTEIDVRCEDMYVTALSVTIVRNFIYILGGLMTLVIVLMTVSFYWQLEHEPIKKAFYHF